MRDQRVRRHLRRYPAHRTRPETARERSIRHAREGISPEEREARATAAALRGQPWPRPGSLAEAVDDVVAGRRTGYTWTRKYRFDVFDSASMARLYDQIGPSIMYVIARTNQTLDRWEARLRARDPNAATIADNVGIGIWRDADGTIYADEISVLRFGEQHDADAIRFARIHGQRYIVKVNGAERTYDFLPTGL